MTIDILYRLKHIDSLIRIKGTGTPDQLAQRLGMSRRSLFDYLNLMKDYGAPIKYCSQRQSYYYETEGRFMAMCTFKEEGEEINI